MTRLRRLTAAVTIALLTSTTALAGVVTVTTSDGVALQALHEGKGKKGVVLLHEAGQTREGWAWVSGKLSAAGFQVIAPDLRGHGGSKGATTDSDYAPVLEDVKASVAYLRSKGAAEVQLVGGQLGALLAMHAAVADPTIQSVTLISPIASAHGLKASATLEALAERHVLIVAGADDASSVKISRILSEKLPNAEAALIAPGGKGVRMFSQSPDLEPLLAGWLNGSYLQAEAASGPAAVKASALDKIETSGTLLGER